MAKRGILVGYGVGIDAIAGWLGPYGDENSSDDIPRGLPAGEAGIPRLLKLFEKNNIKATRFAPGHSIETFLEQMKMIVDAGHEVGAHGYPHENPVAMTSQQEEDILAKNVESITALTGKGLTGYVAPWWEFSNVTDRPLKKYGIRYDHFLMYRNCISYYVRIGGSRDKIDYPAPVRTWMKPLVRGEETDLVETPANWDLDDLLPLMFIKKSPNSSGFYNPKDIFGMWEDSFDYVYENYDFAVFPMAIHPDVSGRMKTLNCHQHLIDYINQHESIRWCTLDETADEFFKRFSKRQEPTDDGGTPACTPSF